MGGMNLDDWNKLSHEQQAEVYKGMSDQERQDLVDADQARAQAKWDAAGPKSEFTRVGPGEGLFPQHNPPAVPDHIRKTFEGNFTSIGASNVIHNVRAAIEKAENCEFSGTEGAVAKFHYAMARLESNLDAVDFGWRGDKQLSEAYHETKHVMLEGIAEALRTDCGCKDIK